MPAPEGTRVCGLEECDIPLPWPGPAGGRPRRYCCDSHRVEDARRRALRQEAASIAEHEINKRGVSLETLNKLAATVSVLFADVTLFGDELKKLLRELSLGPSQYERLNRLLEAAGTVSRGLDELRTEVRLPEELQKKVLEAHFEQHPRERAADKQLALRARFPLVSDQMINEALKSTARR